MLEQTIEEMMPYFKLVARSYAQSLARYRIESEDLVQEATIALWHCEKIYTGPPEEFVFYARRAATNAINAYISRFINGNTTYSGHLVDEYHKRCSASVEEMLDSGQNIAGDNEQEEVVNDISVNDFVKSLPETERNVASLIVSNEVPFYEIRHELGLTPKEFDRALTSIRTRLRPFNTI